MRIEIRGDNVTLSEEVRQTVDRKARLSLGRVAAAIRAVRIVIRDLNGPKSGDDQSCSVQVHLARGGEVHVSAENDALPDAIDRALERASRSTLRMIARQQTFRRERPLQPTAENRY